MALKKNKYISKKNIISLLLFVAVIAVAFLFDHLNKNEIFSINNSNESPATKTVDLSQYYYYNPVNTSTINLANKPVPRKLFLRTQDKFVQQYHNHKTFHHSKSESVLLNTSDFIAQHLVLIKQIHYINPDDTPPLS
jgi:hypothetical protein